VSLPPAINDIDDNAVRYQACFCAENLHFILRKINKNCCHSDALFGSNMNKIVFVVWGFAQTPLEELTAILRPRNCI